MNVKPVADRVLIKQDKPKEKSDGGIILPDATRQAPGRGTVLEVGPLVEEIQIGDIVLYNKYDATIIVMDDREFAVIKEDNIQVRIRE